MFKVEFFVDDKRLGFALLALVGLAQGQPAVTPVVNAVATKQGVSAKTDGKALDRFAAELKQHRAHTIVSRDTIPMLKAAGISVTSRSYILKQAEAAKLLKRSGTGSATKYLVL